MNNFKKTGGFTLVELIVVIAILGILAAVAVPAYSGYITKAHEAADITQLDAIKTAAMATVAEEGALEELTLTVTAKAITKVEANGDDITDNEDFVLYYGSDDLPKLQISRFSTAKVPMLVRLITRRWRLPVLALTWARMLIRAMPLGTVLPGPNLTSTPKGPYPCGNVTT